MNVGSCKNALLLNFFFVYIIVFTSFKELKAVNSFNYRYIETNKTKIYFREDIEKEAKNLASKADFLLDVLSKDYDFDRNKCTKPHKYSIIINDHSFKSNGYTFFDKAIFYSLDSQNGDLIDWMLFLMIHEGRHLVQFSSIFNSFGLPKNTLQAAWYMEGDAVYAETLYSKGGRGRNPGFLRDYRAYLFSGKKYSFSKHQLGFMKDKPMDYYTLGYLLLMYIKHNYGEEFFKKIFVKENSFFFSFLSSKIKSATSLTIDNLYDKMNKELREVWSEQQSHLQINSFENVIEEDLNDWVNFYYPKIDSNGDCFAIKTSLDTHMCIAEVKNQSSIEVLRVNPENMKENGFSVAAHRVAFIQKNSSLFKGIKDDSYSVVYVYDLIKKKNSIINHKARYSSVDLSSDGKMLLVVENAPDYTNSINVLDVDSKKLLKKFFTTENRSIRQPKWSSDKKSIIAVAVYQNKNQFLILDYQTGNIKYISPIDESEMISGPILHDNIILYNSTYGGVERICATDLFGQKKYQVVCSKFGVFNPCVSADNQWIYFNNFTDGGTKISRIKFDKSTWIDFNDIYVDKTDHFYDIQTNGSDLLDEKIILNKKEDNFSVKKYSVLMNMFNFDNFIIDLQNTIYSSFLNKGFYPFIKMEDNLHVCSLLSSGMYDFANNLFLFRHLISYLYFPVSINLRLQYNLILDYNRYLHENYCDQEFLQDSISVALAFPIKKYLLDKVFELNLSNFAKLSREIFTNNIWLSNGYSIVIQNNTIDTIVRRSICDYYQEVMLKYDRVNDLHNNHVSKHKGYAGYGFLCGLQRFFPCFKYSTLLFRSSYQYVNSVKSEILDELNSLLKVIKTNFKQLLAEQYSSFRFMAEYFVPLCYIDKGLDSYIFFERLWGLFGIEYIHNIEKNKSFKDNFVRVHFGCMLSCNFASIKKYNIGSRFSYIFPFSNLRKTKGMFKIDIIFDQDLYSF